MEGTSLRCAFQFGRQSESIGQPRGSLGRVRANNIATSDAHRF